MTDNLPAAPQYVQSMPPPNLAAPPQNFGPPPFPPQHQTTFVVQAPVFGDVPTQTVCANCHQSIATTITTVNGSCTWIWCFVICLCCFPCFFIPFVTDCSKDVRHSCPNCGTIVGLSKKI